MSITLKPTIFQTPTGFGCAVNKQLIHGGHWKKWGLVGHGSTPEEAYEDWEAWVRSSELFNDIY